MLPKNKRLKRSADIDRVFSEGATVRGDFFICKYIQNGLQEDRPMFTIAKSLTKKAFAKNRLRRQAIHAYKEIEQLGGLDTVFILNKLPTESKKRYDAFKSDLSQINKKIHG